MQIPVGAVMAARLSYVAGAKRHSGSGATQPVSMQIATFSFRPSIQQSMCFFKPRNLWMTREKLEEKSGGELSEVKAKVGKRPRGDPADSRHVLR
ncbi:hypothetical protein E2C01_036667 [Portunus trituberculatus]|uniref:Uncharacterized protein n=1 Tax=Portunus trituberculatus TaxID=210409 RepID=A0A5B7F9A5_PORTR|nr:hypothetical protein [Portunus trituberculatus]